MISVTDQGCLSRIPDLIKEFKYLTQKNGFLVPGNMIWVVHPRSGSRILPFTHPRSRVQKGIGSRIRIRNTEFDLTKNIYRKCNMDIKFFLLISNLLKKLLKQLCEKSYQPKSDRKLSFLLFLLSTTVFGL